MNSINSFKKTISELNILDKLLNSIIRNKTENTEKTGNTAGNSNGGNNVYNIKNFSEIEELLKKLLEYVNIQNKNNFIKHKNIKRELIKLLKYVNIQNKNNKSTPPGLNNFVNKKYLTKFKNGKTMTQLISNRGKRKNKTKIMKNIINIINSTKKMKKILNNTKKFNKFTNHIKKKKINSVSHSQNINSVPNSQNINSETQNSKSQWKNNYTGKTPLEILYIKAQKLKEYYEMLKKKCRKETYVLKSEIKNSSVKGKNYKRPYRIKCCMCEKIKLYIPNNIDEFTNKDIRYIKGKESEFSTTNAQKEKGNLCKICQEYMKEVNLLYKNERRNVVTKGDNPNISIRNKKRLKIQNMTPSELADKLKDKINSNINKLNDIGEDEKETFIVIINNMVTDIKQKDDEIKLSSLNIISDLLQKILNIKQKISELNDNINNLNDENNKIINEIRSLKRIKKKLEKRQFKGLQKKQKKINDNKIKIEGEKEKIKDELNKLVVELRKEINTHKTLLNSVHVNSQSSISKSSTNN